MINVLAIDDDLDFQDFLSVKLLASEYCLTMTSSESEFYEKFESMSFDICLLDLCVGQNFFQGLEILTKIREKNNQIPIIMLSNSSSKKIISKALEIGANDFLSKPIDTQLLMVKINALVSGTQAFGQKLDFGNLSVKHPHVTLSTQLNLKAITANGVLIEGNAFVAKGAKIKLQSERIKEVFGVNSIEVYSSGFTTEGSGDFLTTLEIDPDDKELINSAKMWIKANQK